MAMKKKPKRPKPTTICEEFCEQAYRAVDDWDGQDNGDLIRLLAVKLGMSHADLKLIAYEMQHDGRGARP
jgi:hypothetical protein